jgi:hypothetical protein
MLAHNECGSCEQCQGTYGDSTAAQTHYTRSLDSLPEVRDPLGVRQEDHEISTDELQSPTLIKKNC